MTPLSPPSLMSYWSVPEVSVNLMIFLHIAGALLLGLAVGYERTYHGRAAGMRTYGLVCMASAALTVLAGFPGYWFAGHAAVQAAADPTRIIQGIVTGIGFLGAGVIMKDGMTIIGLTTAASLWASSVIGILVGVGFYTAAILLTAVSAASMLLMGRIEHWLPSHPGLSFVVCFRPGAESGEAALRHLIRERGYLILPATLTASRTDGRLEWRFVAVERRRGRAEPLPRVVEDLTAVEAVDHFQVSHARN